MDGGVWWATYGPYSCEELDMIEVTYHAHTCCHLVAIWPSASYLNLTASVSPFVNFG